MSRVERKKIENKFKRFRRICIFIQIILLICGLLVVDSQVRATLGIDEIGLISCKHTGGSEYKIYIMGNPYMIDFSTIRFKTYDKFAQLNKMAYSIREWVKQGLQRVSY